MEENSFNQVGEYLKEHSKRRRWQKVLTVLSCIVVFCTTYALILPAITMTQTPTCGLEEHVHGEDCFKETPAAEKLDCKAQIHLHTSSCLDKNKNAVCGFADFVIHEHNEKCRDESGKLVCNLPEIFEHKHSEKCYEQTVSYICGLEESPGHTHSEQCRDENGNLVCTLEETEGHKHTEDCTEKKTKLVCGKEEISLHEHTDACYENGELKCKKTEILRHEHGQSCFETVKAERILICTKQEHWHDEVKCYDEKDALEKYSCGFGEHTHGKDCFDENGKLLCSVPEHKHTEECLPSEKTSENPSSAPAAKPGRLSISPSFEISAKLKKKKSAAKKARSAQQNAQETDNDIRDYLTNTGGKYSITILNKNNTPLEKDANGNYIVAPQQEYKLTLSLFAPDGFIPGTYVYQLPQGLEVNAGQGDFVIDSVNIGSWTVDSTGKITLNFNSNANEYNDVTISATMGVAFDESVSSIEFDGEITVVIKKPSVENSYEIGKYSDRIIYDAPDGNEHVHWIVNITSDEELSLVGKTVTDTVTQKYWENHKYTAYDKEQGVHFKGTAPDGTVYEWTAFGNGDGLIWGEDEHSWSYVIPETVTTTNGETVTLGEGWSYAVDYNTTVTDNIHTGLAVYRNTAQIGDKSVLGWQAQNRGGIVGSIYKEGILNNKTIHWTINQGLSGHVSGEKYPVWYFWDYMLMLDGSTNQLKEDDGKYIPGNPWVPGSAPFNVPLNMKVVVMRNGTEYAAADATQTPASDTDEPRYGYKAIMPDDTKMGWHFYICMACKCDEHPELCYEKNSDGVCSSRDENGWCTCWRETDDVSVTITYDTDAEIAIEEYGGVGDYLRNTMEAYRNGERLANADDDIVLPGVFEKSLIKDPDNLNGYIASYKITANEALLDLSELENLLIVDTMTDTLVYIPGTMVITAEDKNGNVRTLKHEVDYTLQYSAEEHQIKILILNPKTEKYTLNYDTQIVIPKGATSVKYSNSATVEMFGKSIKSETEEKIVADINISAKNYQVTVKKTDYSTGKALAGAQFELNTADDERVAFGTTDENGRLVFKTNVTDGVILREHIAYYLYETRPPDGYVADGQKHWIVFCDGDENCARCAEFAEAYWNILRIPANEGITVTVENKTVSYTLPETGSFGTYLFTISGLLLIAVSLLYGFGLRRKQERRKT